VFTDPASTTAGQRHYNSHGEPRRPPDLSCPVARVLQELVKDVDAE